MPAKSTKPLKPILASEITFVNQFLGKRVETRNGRLYIYDDPTQAPTIVCLGKRAR